MADDGFDPCECIWDQHFAMRRLMALLRQSQSYCTDTECLETLPGPEGSSEQNLFLMTFLAIGLGLFLIAFRPNSLRNSAPASKQRDNDTEPDDSAPPPMY